MTPVRQELIDAAPNLKIIGMHGVGLDGIDVDYATEKGIAVTRAAAANCVSVAEHVINAIVHGVQAAIGFRAAAIGEKGDLPETHPVQPRTESKRPCRLTRAKPASKGSDRALSV